MADMASSRFSAVAVASMFETDEFPEDSLSSESEEDGLDLSDPDAGAYTTSEGEDMDGGTASTSEIADNASEVKSSEEDSISSADESPLPKRYVKLFLHCVLLSYLQ